MKFAKLHDQIMSAENSLTKTPAGNGGYDHDDSLAPKRSMKPQTPAQHAAVMKAAKKSVQNRKIAAGLPLIGSKPVVGM